MIEEKNEEKYQQVFNWFKDVIKNNFDDEFDFDSKIKKLTFILEKHNQKYFNINIEDYEEVKIMTEEVFTSNIGNSRNKKNLLNLLKSFLKNYSASINENEKAKSSIENKNEEEKTQLKNMVTKDKDFYKEQDFDSKVNFKCSKRMGKKNLSIDKKYIFDVMENFDISPAQYKMRDVVADNKKLIDNNERRYEIFYQRFEDYFEKNSKFERKFDKFPELNSEVIFIGRVILFQNDLKLKKNKVILIEYQTSTGFDYVTSSFQNIKDFFIFSNQMLILKGRKKKELFIVDQIINNLEFTNSQLSLKTQKKNTSPTPLSKNMKILIIRGSFYQKNIDFEDLRVQIRKAIIKNKITLLIIIGPIIHTHRKNHPETNSYPSIEEDFEQMLSEIGTTNLKMLYITDPSELTNYYNLPINPKRIVNINAPNPSIIKLGSFSLAFTASNLLDDLLMRSKFSFSEAIEDGEIFEIEKIERGLEALLESRNLAPVYGENSQVDPWMYNCMDYEVQPDLFFVCSNSLDGFVTKIGDTHFVNFKSFIGKERFGDFVIVGLDSGDSSVSVEIYENN